MAWAVGAFTFCCHFHPHPTTPCTIRPKFRVLRFTRGGATFEGGTRSKPLQFAVRHPAAVGAVTVRATIHNASFPFQFSLSNAPKGFLVDPLTVSRAFVPHIGRLSDSHFLFVV